MYMGLAFICLNRLSTGHRIRYRNIFPKLLDQCRAVVNCLYHIWRRSWLANAYSDISTARSTTPTKPWLVSTGMQWPVRQGRPSIRPCQRRRSQFLAAYHDAGASDAPQSASHVPSPGKPSGDIPTSIADGRYQVEKFLGEGGKKMVYLP